MSDSAEAIRGIGMSRLMNAIEKRAAFWRSFGQAFNRSSAGGALGEAALSAAASAGIAAIGVGAKKGFEALRTKIEKPQLFKEMVGASPGLKKMDQKKVQMTFNTLYRMNREMAKDPLVAGSFVERSVGRAELSDSAGTYVDPATAKTLLESRPKDEHIMRAFTSALPARTPEAGLGERMRSQAKLERYKSQLAQGRESSRHIQGTPQQPYVRSSRQPPLPEFGRGSGGDWD
jgi:hypothetical protein